MDHNLTIFYANKKINDAMSTFDMKPDFKWFVVPVQATIISKSSKNLAPRTILKFMELANAATGDDFLIKAIQYKGLFYHDGTVKELSDGEHNIYIQNNSYKFIKRNKGTNRKCAKKI